MKKLIILFLLLLNYSVYSDYKNKIEIKKMKAKINYFVVIGEKKTKKTSSLFYIKKTNWLGEDILYKGIYINTKSSIFYLCYGYKRCLLLIVTPDNEIYIYDDFDFQISAKKKYLEIKIYDYSGKKIIIEIER